MKFGQISNLTQSCGRFRLISVNLMSWAISVISDELPLLTLLNQYETENITWEENVQKTIFFCCVLMIFDQKCRA